MLWRLLCVMAITLVLLVQLEKLCDILKAQKNSIRWYAQLKCFHTKQPNFDNFIHSWKWEHFDQEAIGHLSTLSESPVSKLPKACFSFEIGLSTPFKS